MRLGQKKMKKINNWIKTKQNSIVLFNIATLVL